MTTNAKNHKQLLNVADFLTKLDPRRFDHNQWNAAGPQPRCFTGVTFQDVGR